MKRYLPLIVGCAALAAGLVVAGPLTPPAGPVASTYKTLSEVEPRVAINAANTPGDASSVFRITQPGSYYLTGNVPGQAGKAGVAVAASGVTLDLNGFSITGGGAGVITMGSLTGVSVRNGTISGCAGIGVNLNAVDGGSVTDLSVSACVGTGVAVGTRGRALRCSAAACGTGFSCGDDARLESCVSSQSGDYGFYSGAKSCAFVRCSATAGASVGFALGYSDDAILESCVARGNTESGVVAGDGTRLSGCVAADNGDTGLFLGWHDLVEGCVVRGNADIGIVADNGCVVRDCQVSANAHQGIRAVGYGVTVIGNHVSSNGAGLAGIWISGTGCRVEDNRSLFQGFGVYVDGTDNFVARNTCRGNSNQNYSVAGGNELAPIVTNPGSNNFTTATAWSNFAY